MPFPRAFTRMPFLPLAHMPLRSLAGFCAVRLRARAVALLFRCDAMRSCPQGKEYIFISNVDNLGATVDLDMLYHIFDQEAEFAVEAIERTRADLSGGLVVGYGGKPKVVELSTVPADRRDQFVKRFNLFNTNNM